MGQRDKAPRVIVKHDGRVEAALIAHCGIRPPGGLAHGRLTAGLLSRLGTRLQ
jgi:hypothetical protein